MSNRNFDNRVIIKRLQDQNYARNLYKNNTTGQTIITNPQNSDGNASRFLSYLPGAQTEYFRGLLGNGVTSSIGGIVNIPPYPLPIVSVSPPVPPVTTGGSMFFDSTFGSDGSHVSYPNDTNLRIGTQPFTIEWYQYWTTGGSSFPRVFSIGTYPSADIAVSYEGDFILWINGSPIFIGSGDPPQNVWTHMAIVGDGSFVKTYQDGIENQGVVVPYNFTDSSTALMIGNETNPSSIANFNGQITNFRWVVGTAVYTADFTPPTSPLTAIPGTQLLLLAENNTNVVLDSSGAARTPTNTGVTYSATTPF
jgi:hypothetical protein